MSADQIFVDQDVPVCTSCTYRIVDLPPTPGCAFDYSCPNCGEKLWVEPREAVVYTTRSLPSHLRMRIGSVSKYLAALRRKASELDTRPDKISAYIDRERRGLSRDIAYYENLLADLGARLQEEEQ